MKINKRKKLIVSMILILGVIAGYFIYGNILRSNFDYEISYPLQCLSFGGDFEGHTLMFSSISISLADYDQDFDKPPIFKKCSVLIHINGQTITAEDISQDMMKELGAEMQSVTSSVTTWRVYSPSGHNPSYLFACNFYKDKAIGVSFNLQNPPDIMMRSPMPSPFSFTIDKTHHITLPITIDKLETILGQPAGIYKHLKWP